MVLKNPELERKTLDFSFSSPLLSLVTYNQCSVNVEGISGAP